MVTQHSPRITARFVVVLFVVIPVVCLVGGAGLNGLSTGRRATNTLYSNHLKNIQTVTSLNDALQAVEQTALLALLAGDAGHQKPLIDTLLTERVPAVDRDISAVSDIADADKTERALLGQLKRAWMTYETGLARGVQGDVERSSLGLAKITGDILGSVGSASAAAKGMIQHENALAEQAHRAALESFRRQVIVIVSVGLIGLLLAAGIVGWLIRSVLPRTLTYTAFAADLAHGEYGRRLRPDGEDELAELGRALNGMADHQEAEDSYAADHLELIDALQLTESEDEAHLLLKSHLQRSIRGAKATVLNRNNSADRLQAVTPLDADSALHLGLQSAKPRSCLAVRQVRPHSAEVATSALLKCDVCAGSSCRTTCTPLIVSGEVIGSVLVEHEYALTNTDQRSIRETVTQAAPVVGNLRNLAIAELRAATDALTGLPNRRAVDAVVRRMAAHASRQVAPLAALMCDLDHFKQINDKYGHGHGDDVLAAAGAALSSVIRASDFAGRYGGEEFLVLLPDTDTAGALALAEKIRAAIAHIRISSVDQLVTVSIGIALLPDDAGDADSLVRAADRALYSAKSNGRNRVQVVDGVRQQHKADAGVARGARAMPAGVAAPVEEHTGSDINV